MLAMEEEMGRRGEGRVKTREGLPAHGLEQEQYLGQELSLQGQPGAGR